MSIISPGFNKQTYYTIPNRNQFCSLFLPFLMPGSQILWTESCTKTSNGFAVLFGRIVICVDNFAFASLIDFFQSEKTFQLGWKHFLKFCLFHFGRAKLVLLKRDGCSCKGLICHMGYNINKRDFVFNFSKRIKYSVLCNIYI